MEIVQEVIDDLRFYQEMALTPTEMLLGPQAYKKLIQECSSRFVLFTESDGRWLGTLFGVTVKLEPSFAPWARSYKFKEAAG
jgi:hypothetical protein